MSKKGLGKGLDALIPDLDLDRESTVGEVEIARVTPNPRQPRKHFAADKLAELAQSIREHGLVQPLVVRPKGSDFELVAGERRWRAAQLAQLTRVPAIVRDFTDAETMEIALIENLQRQDLDPLEEAEAYRILLEEYHLTQDDLARRLGKSRPQITNTLRLLTLEPTVRDQVSAGEISVGHAKVLLGIDAADQAQWASRVVKQGWSVRQLEDAMLAAPEPTTRPGSRRSRPPGDADLLAVEDALRQHLGAPVKLVPGNPRGRLEIQYFGDADLTRIVDIVLGRPQRQVPVGKRDFHI